MIRTQLQIPEEDYRRLRQVALRQGRSMADCIREGIALFLHRAACASDDLSDIPVFRARGAGDLKDHDRWWAETVVSGD